MIDNRNKRITNARIFLAVGYPYIYNPIHLSKKDHIIMVSISAVVSIGITVLLYIAIT